MTTLLPTFGDPSLPPYEQVEWLAGICVETAFAYGLPIVVLGNYPMLPTRLVDLLTTEREGLTVAYKSPVDTPFSTSAVFCIATNHGAFATMKFPAESLVVDVWGLVADPADDSYAVWRA